MEQKKRCPLCGEEILAVAVKCRRCKSSLDGKPHSIQSQFHIRTPYKIAGAFLLVIIGGPMLYNIVTGGSALGGGFGDAEIKATEDSIKTELGKRPGVEVTEVKMMKESSKKLTGFAKIKVPLIGEMMKSCSATMGEGSQYIWECK